jgi:hypothetical protein
MKLSRTRVENRPALDPASTAVALVGRLSLSAGNSLSRIPVSWLLEKYITFDNADRIILRLGIRSERMSEDHSVFGR